MQHHNAAAIQAVADEGLHLPQIARSVDDEQAALPHATGTGLHALHRGIRRGATEPCREVVGIESVYVCST